MATPDADRAVVEDAKVRDYLFNLEHPDGGSKAIWFHSLGYDRIEWQCLGVDLLDIARNCTAFDTETAAFGVKYKAMGAIGRPEFGPGVVLTVWIVEADGPTRLVTASARHL